MARRVNTRFLIILTTALAVLIVGAFGVYFVMKRRGNPTEYLAKADQLMAAKEYDKALANFRQATGLRPNDPAMWVRYGDAHSKLAALDPENMMRATGCWRKALEIDPNNKEALQRMLRVSRDQLDRTSPRDLPKMISETQDVARKLTLADPKDMTVAAIGPELVIRGWTGGIGTDAQKIDDAITKLKEIGAKNPEDPGPPRWASIALLNRALESARERRMDEARKSFTEAEALMLSAAKAQPDNALMQLRAGEFLLTSRQLVGIMGAATTAPSEGSPDAVTAVDPATSQPGNPVAQRVELARKHFDRAAELAKPDHPSYIEIQLAAGGFAQQRFDRVAAEKRYREVLSHYPDAQDARLRLAALLAIDPAKRAEAIALLDKPVDPESMAGAKGLMAQQLRLQTLLALANIRLDQYAETSDQGERKKLMTTIEDGISKVAAIAPGGQDNPVTLKLRGKQQRATGKNVESIQTLNRALT
ncbi:MAG: hypothetical protein H0T11_09680, partial [Chthoniobacterales bacterium]|nr:hypothetical protein [Chthoniobacterales bacterium]